MNKMTKGEISHNEKVSYSLSKRTDDLIGNTVLTSPTLWGYVWVRVIVLLVSMGLILSIWWLRG